MGQPTPRQCVVERTRPATREGPDAGTNAQRCEDRGDRAPADRPGSRGAVPPELPGAAQSGATVAVAPGDADAAARGHQVTLPGTSAVAVTVTSADGTRMRDYRVTLVPAGPAAECLRGAVAVDFSLVFYAGGSIEELADCAENHGVTALYALHAGGWAPYIPGAPDIVNRRFRALFPGGLPAVTPLLVRSEA